MRDQLQSQLSLQEFKPSRAAITAALGEQGQADPRVRNMPYSINEQPGNGSLVSGWQQPGKPHIPNQQFMQPWRNPFNNDRVH